MQEYALRVFEEIRKRDGITNENIKESMDLHTNREAVFKSGQGSGKSGSFFFFSKNKEFIVKTMTETEKNVFLSMLPSYLNHLLENPKSLLARIYGLYTVQIDEQPSVSLLLMANSTKTVHTDCIRHCFDLKGSLTNRNVKIGKDYVPKQTLKDVNFIWLK